MDLLHAYFKLFGKNLVFSGGIFRGVEIPKDLTDDLIDGDLPYIGTYVPLHRSAILSPNQEVEP